MSFYPSPRALCPSCGMGDLIGFSPSEIDEANRTTTYHCKCNTHNCQRRYRVVVPDNGRNAI
jgi:hypothetical protein